MQHLSLIKRYFLYIILILIVVFASIYYTLPELKKIIPSRSIVVEKQANVDQLQMQVDEFKKRNQILQERGRHLDRQVYKPEYNTTSPIVALSSVMEDITKFLEFNNLRIISINYTEILQMIFLFRMIRLNITYVLLIYLSLVLIIIYKAS